MSNDCSKSASRPFRQQRSIYQVHYGLQKQKEEMAKPFWKLNEPLQVSAYDRQVAGHTKTENTKYLGLLQCNNGTILKPILKEAQQREVHFYKTVANSENADIQELRKYKAKCYGVKKFTYNGYEQEYIILEDLTERMLEPCIMDVKIGKRTWDPLATEEKKANEQKKYTLCKQEYGFCIPGYQVYKLSTGKLYKYNKEHGKKLHGQMVIAAIKNFLNGMGTHLCRALILQFLSELWKIQKWAGRQTAVRLYSTSLLLVYDATRLRDCCGEADVLIGHPRCLSPARATRRKSIHSTHSPSSGSNFSGLITSNGPVYKKVNSVPLASMTLVQSTFSSPPALHSPWIEALETLHHNHSFEHNYDDKLSKIKMNYRALLDQLSSESPTPNPWGTVKIIDFAHAFFNEEEEEEMTIDYNFKEGIDNLVSIFETLLRETDDQVMYTFQ